MTLKSLSLSLAGEQARGHLLGAETRTSGPPGLVGRRSSAASRWASGNAEGAARPSPEMSGGRQTDSGVVRGSDSSASAGALNSWVRLVPGAGSHADPSSGRVEGPQGLGPWSMQ